jgi:uncharacterized protein
MKLSLINCLLAAGLFSLAPMGHAQELGFAHVETVGLSQLQVEPDMAELTVEVVLTEANAKTAKDKSDMAVANFIARLQQAGVAKEMIQSANLNLQPQYKYEPNHERELVGYSASREIIITIKELPRLNDILDAALEEGLNRVSNIALKSSRQTEYVAKARQLAIADARAKAQSLAEGFDMKLGAVWEIRYLEPAPMRPVMYKAAMMAEAGGADESYQYGRVTVEDRVEVVFRLK